MKIKAVHQFHSGSAYGDAVSNSLLFTRSILRGMGFKSEIYVQYIADELADNLRSYKDYKSSPSQILIVHHSIGHDLIHWLLELPDLKILFYHNITPFHFFPEGSDSRKYAEIGRQQLELLKQKTMCAICNSTYTAQELESLGYEHVSVLPLLFDITKIRRAPWNHNLINLHSGTFNVLFVGRIVENKCQHDLINIFRHLRTILDRASQLILVGKYHPGERYFQYLLEIINDYGLQNSVKLLGKISNEDLYGWYRASDVFVSMSDHEGFGVPLVESMIFDLPVVACASTSVPFTMGGSGILVKDKNPEEIAGLLSILSKDRALRRAIIKHQRKRLQDFTPSKLKTDLANILVNLGVNIPHMAALMDEDVQSQRWRLEGPFETSYSLAIVNRELALTLEEENPGEVALFAAEGPGDYEPNINDIRDYPGLEELWNRSKKGAAPHVVIRNLYPPRVEDMNGLVNILNYAWEESNIPQEWVKKFNEHLDCITVTSQFVKKVFIDSGVHVPIIVVGNGADHILHYNRACYPGHLGKSFRFLHISSCFPRKGVDVLLEAYANAFTFKDDVSLIIKTFPNIHNKVEEQIKNLEESRPKCPDIILINEDLSFGQIIDLYHRCHAYVSPSRGEGFGLPMAEAMLFEMPVITTKFGGQSDFCSDQTCWTIDYHFENSESHMDLPDSVWAEPDVKQLVDTMRQVYQASQESLNKKTKLAKQVVSREYSWKRCAERIREAVREIESERPLAKGKINLGWVTTWNAKCGVATYSSYLVKNFVPDVFDIKIFASRKDILLNEDEKNVIRCWDDKRNPDLDDLKAAILREEVAVVVIQFNFVFFKIKAFGRLVESLHGHGIKTIIIFHSTQDVTIPGLEASLSSISSQLALADRLLVHGISDLNRFKDFGLVNNVTLFPHGVLHRPIRDPLLLRERFGLSDSRIIASYGFLLPHKGIQELITAFPRILDSFPNTLMFLVNAIYPFPISEQVSQECMETIDRFGIRDRVIMINEYLDDEESFCLLECADLLVFPYQDTEESSSGAIKIGIGTNRPVACTQLEIFGDVKDVVHFLPGTAPEDIATGIINLLHKDDLLKNKHEIQQKWLKAHSWSAMAYRLSGMIRALVQ